MKSLYCLVLLSVLLVSCSGGAPSRDSVGTAVSMTLTAQSLATHGVAQITSNPALTVTNIQPPTRTPKPTWDQHAYETQVFATAAAKPTRQTSTPMKSLEEERIEFSQVIAAAIEEMVSDIDTFNMARINNGRFEIELKTKWASQDSQPDVSYQVVQVIAQLFNDASFSAESAAYYAESDEFTVNLVTYSADGDYRYESLTDYDTLMQIANKLISYDEWVTASNAGFR
jgi:hypothetical protein